MTNSLAFWLGLIIAAVFVIDYLYLDIGIALTLLRGLVALIGWLAFWR